LIWNEILCLGDSITCGARDEYGRSYPIELARILTDRTGEVYVCHEHAVCGETSSDLLKRSWDNTARRNAARIALVLIGTNDTACNIPAEIYEDNIRQIVNILKIHGKHIIFGLLPKLEFTPIYYKNTSLIDEYNKVLKRKRRKEYLRRKKVLANSTVAVKKSKPAAKKAAPAKKVVAKKAAKKVAAKKAPAKKAAAKKAPAKKAAKKVEEEEK